MPSSWKAIVFRKRLVSSSLPRLSCSKTPEVRLGRVGPAPHQFGDDGEDVGGGAAVAEAPGVRKDPEVEALRRGGVDGEAGLERTGGEDVAGRGGVRTTRLTVA